MVEISVPARVNKKIGLFSLYSLNVVKHASILKTLIKVVPLRLNNLKNCYFLIDFFERIFFDRKEYFRRNYVALNLILKYFLPFINLLIIPNVPILLCPIR